MKNVIDKDTGIFLRNDYTCKETEKMIEAAIPYELYAIMGVCPMWDGEKWVQNVEPPTHEPQPQEPSEAERLEALEMLMVDILGGGF